MVHEERITLIAEGFDAKGHITLSHTARFEGALEGSLEASAGTLVIGESGSVRGTLQAETVIIDGFVDGEITATSVRLSSLARVFGSIHAKSLKIDAGAHFDGKVLPP